MSVQGQIDRLKQNVSSAYSAIQEMGGTIPANANSQNLADAIRSIPTGGGAKPPAAYEVFGVCWDYYNPSTALTRLTPDTDPNGFTTKIVEREPVPGVGGLDGSSPFDNFLPWSGMEEYNYLDFQMAYKRGDNGFSRTLYHTMVYIPDFWYACIDDPMNGKRYWYVSGKERDGFQKHPGSGKYVSRYTVNSLFRSTSGNQSIVDISRAQARTMARSIGTGWQLYDYAALTAVQLLYLVEYADWNSQAKIGLGYINYNASQINTGATDSMTYHTGRAAGADGKTAVQYRHIENPWGNLYQFVDGINFDNGKAYVCLNPAQYADDTTTNYTDTGISIPSVSGYISNLGYNANEPWLLIPDRVDQISGSKDMFISDYIYTDKNGKILTFGGFFGDGISGGVFFFNVTINATFMDPVIGVRTAYDPAYA